MGLWSNKCGKLLLHLANVVENLNKKFSISFISLNIYYASVHPGMGAGGIMFLGCPSVRAYTQVRDSTPRRGILHPACRRRLVSLQQR